MANPKISTVFLQHLGDEVAPTGYLKYSSVQLTAFGVTPDKISVGHGGKTYDYPRADYTPPPAPVPAPAPPPVSSDKPTLTWVQKNPIGSNSKFPIPVGYFAVSGGKGPYLIGVTDPTGKYRLSGGYTLYTAEVAVGAATDTLSAVVYDGRMVKSDPISFTVAKEDGDGAGINTPLSLPSFSPVWTRLRTDAYPLFGVGAHGPGHADVRQDSISVADPKGVWQGSGLTIWSPRGLPPVGDYPIDVTVTNAATRVTTTFHETLTITPVPDVIAEFVPTITETDTTPEGTELGVLCATVPDNAPQFTTDSPYRRVDPATRKVYRVGSPPLGDLTWNYTVASGGTALVKTFQAKSTIKKGTRLDPTDMALALNKLDNSTPGQTVGPLSVKGQTGGRYVILKQSGYNPNAILGQYGNPARYQISGTQAITPPGCLLSWQDPACGWEDDKLTISWTSDDGLTSCIQTFTIPVADTANVVVLRATDGPSFHAANARCGTYHPGIKYRLEVAANTNPDAYTDATRGEDTKGGWIGPVDIVLAPGVRLGGKADNTGVNSGITSYGKGYLLASHGDVRIIGGTVSAVHGGSSSAGIEGIRKDGQTYGNLVLDGVSVEDCDQGIEAGVCHGYIYARGISVRRCGAASVGAGLTHGLYIGNVSKFEMVDSYVDGTPWGHLVKSRAIQTILRRNRIYDTDAAACCLDIPDGGDVLLEGNDFLKGPFATNPAVVNYGAENAPNPVNRLISHGNTFNAQAISYGGNYGPIVALVHYHLPGDAPSMVSSDGDTFFLPPLGQVSMDVTVYATPGTTTVTNPVMLTVPPPVNPKPALTTRPYRHRMILDSQQEFANFNGAVVLSDTLKFDVSGPAKVCTLTPVGDIVGGADPFAAGWASALVRDPVYNQRSLPAGQPWAPDGAFKMSGGDLVYNSGLSPGLYFVQPRFTSTDGKAVVNTRIRVTVRS